LGFSVASRAFPIDLDVLHWHARFLGGPQRAGEIPVP
jgi:hypothetical protein